MKTYLIVATVTLAALSAAGCIGKGKAPPPAPVVAPAPLVTKG
jgi:hypothetical protein